MSNGCQNPNSGPDVVVNGPTGTTPPCPDGAANTVCLPQRCCNFFNLPADGGGDSFFFSAGGPFEVGIAACSETCPPPGGAAVLETPTSGGFINPGILSNLVGGGAEAGIVCWGQCFSGSFQLTARVELVNAFAGERVQVLFYPDCKDVSSRFIVLDCGVECIFVCTTGTAAAVGTQPVCKVCTGDLSVFLQGSNPGFQLLVTQPCTPASAPVSPTPPSIRNFQFKALRMTNRNVVDCSGSPTVAASQYLADCQVFECVPVPPG